MVDKIVDPGAAARAYVNSGQIKTNDVPSDGKVSFSDFLRSKAQEAVDVMHHSEQTSARAVTGEADITDVVQAVTAAELTLQTVVSVRDRLVSAYQEVMRMPI